MYKREPGYLKTIQINDVAIYIHWSFPLGGLFIAWFFDQEANRIIYFVVAYVLLILVHELGHLLVALLCGLKVFAVTIFGSGGMCFCEEPKLYREAFLLYGGGIIAQVALFLLAIIYISSFGYPSS